MVYTNMAFLESNIPRIKQDLISRCSLLLANENRADGFLLEHGEKKIGIDCYQIPNSNELISIGDFGDCRLLAITSYSKNISREMLECIIRRTEYIPLEYNISTEEKIKIEVMAEDSYDNLYAR